LEVTTASCRGKHRGGAVVSTAELLLLLPPIRALLHVHRQLAMPAVQSQSLCSGAAHIQLGLPHSRASPASQQK
jgi:hypothetical protein